LQPGGSIAPRYVLHLLLREKSRIAKKNSTTTKAREKLAKIWNP
jgi:hypothetical protein